MANYAKKLYHVTKQQYDILLRGESITVNNVTYTGMDPDAIYLVRPISYSLSWDNSAKKLDLLENGQKIGTSPTVGFATTAGTLTTKLGYDKGGTDQTSWTKGDILYASNNNTLSRLAASGQNGKYLKMVSGLPSWTPLSLSDLPSSSTANRFLKVGTANSTPAYSAISFTDLPTGTGSTQVAIGNHGHGNISNVGAIGTTSGRLIETGANGVLVAKTAGTATQYLRGDNSFQTLNLDVVSDGATRKLINYELLSNKQTTGTMTNSVTKYPSTGFVKTYVDTSINALQLIVNGKVEEAPNDGKVFARQNKDWSALESATALRNSLAWRDTEEGEIYIPAEIVDGGTI